VPLPPWQLGVTVTVTTVVAPLKLMLTSDFDSPTQPVS
jgi:hypothetical protein